MRTIAVLFVVIRHLLSTANDPSSTFFYPQALGIFGVLIFFVHTSLVLMMSMDRHGKQTKPPFAKGYASFMVRRAFRIYPLSILVVLVASFLLLPKGWYAGDFQVTPTVVLSNLLLIQNVVGGHNVIAPLWSLPIEVQMYLFLPFLYLLVSDKGDRFLTYAIWPLSVIIALSALKLVWIPDFLRFAPCFIPGVIAFGMIRRGVRPTLPWWTMFILVFALLTVYMMIVKRVHGQFVFGYPACLAIGLMIAYVQDIPSKLKHLKIIVKTIATYSYGIYLFHDIWISLCFGHSPWLPNAFRLPAMLALTAVSAYLGFHWIESPCMTFGSRIAKRFATSSQA